MSSLKMAREKRDSGRPPVPEGTPLAAVYSTPLIRRSSDRPSLCYLDITFLDKNDGGMRPEDIEAIVFKNYYTSSISISMQVGTTSGSTAGSAFVPILENRTLMPSPHYENGSQDWVTIYKSEFNDQFEAGKPLRFFLFQPSSTWQDYEIRHICVVGKLPPSSGVAPVADGGMVEGTADPELFWRNRSLSSLVKADSIFLLQKVATGIRNRKSTGKPASVEDLLQGAAASASSATSATSVASSNAGKAKKKGKEKIKKVGGVNLTGGGIRKEKAVTDGDEKDAELLSDSEPNV